MRSLARELGASDYDTWKLLSDLRVPCLVSGDQKWFNLVALEMALYAILRPGGPDVWVGKKVAATGTPGAFRAKLDALAPEVLAVAEVYGRLDREMLAKRCKEVGAQLVKVRGKKGKVLASAALER